MVRLNIISVSLSLWIPLSIAASYELSVIASYTGYSQSLMPYYTIASTTFWLATTYILVRYLFLDAYRIVLRSLRSLTGSSIFFGYMITHYFLYGLVIEKILGASLTGDFWLGATVAPMTPPSMYTALMSLSLNPTLSIIVGGFVVSLNPSSITLGFLASLLVSANVMMILELWHAAPTTTKSVIVAAPALGVTSGATCCLSIPALIAGLSPVGNAILLSPLGPGVLITLYFVLPIITIAILKLNLNHICRLGK